MAKPKLPKEEIIKRAQRVLRQKGVAGTSMAEIAHACGILKGSLYHHFESKEALVTEVLRSLLGFYQSQIFAVTQEPIPPLRQLKELMKYSEEVFTLERGGCLMASIGMEISETNHPAFTVIREFFTEWEKCMTNIFSNVTTRAVAIEWAEQSVALIEGAVLMMQVFKDPSRLTSAHEFILKEFKRRLEIA